MRELIGKIPTKDPNITEVVYLSEIVRCLECEQTVPMGIEVVTVKLSGTSAIAGDTALTMRRRRKVRRIRPHAHVHAETLRRFDNPIWGAV